MPKSQFSVSERQKVVELHRVRGWSIRRTATAMRCSVATVKRVCARWLADQPLRRKVGSGRPSRLDRHLAARLSQLIIDKPGATSKSLAYDINLHRASPLTPRTIRTYRHKLGFHGVHARPKPALTERHKELRLAFCNEHKDANIDTWVFCDEVGVEAEADGSTYWIRKGEEIPALPRHAHPARVNFWAMVWSNGWSAPVFYDGKMNQDVYADILTKHAVPQLGGQRLMLVQDNATWHGTQAIRDLCSDAKVTVMNNFPPCSPDLNAIEAVWGWLKQKIGPKRCITAADLKHAIREAWRDMPVDTMRGLIHHIPTVMKQIIAAHGGNSK